MDLKPLPNHQEYLKALQELGAEGRFQKMLQLSQFTKDLFLYGLGKRFPDKSEAELKKLFLQRLALCHNQNY